MLSFNTNTLFEIITKERNWYEGFCEPELAKQMKSRHKKGTLGAETYEKLFFHFGYKKELTWTK